MGRRKLKNRLTAKPRRKLLPADFTITEAAKQLNCDHGMVSKILSGQTDPRTELGDTIRRYIADKAGVSVAMFFPGLK